MNVMVSFFLLFLTFSSLYTMEPANNEDENDFMAQLPEELLLALRSHMDDQDALALSMGNRRLRRALLGDLFRDRVSTLAERAFGPTTQELDDDGNENRDRVMARNNLDRIFQAFALDPSSNDQNLQKLISLLGRDFVTHLPMATC